MVALDSNSPRIHDTSEQAPKGDGERDGLVLWGILLVLPNNVPSRFLAEQLTNTGKRQSSRQATLRDVGRVSELHKSDYTRSSGDRADNLKTPNWTVYFCSPKKILYVVKLAMGKVPRLSSEAT
jgi:hypothetical protein